MGRLLMVLQNRWHTRDTLNNQRGMTLIELIVYMAILSTFMAASLLLLSAGNEFASETKEFMQVQSEFRLASIFVKNSIKRNDFVGGFALVPTNAAEPNIGRQISFKSENNISEEALLIYYDVMSKKLMEKRRVQSISSTGSAVIKVIEKPICYLDEFRVTLNPMEKTVEIKMSYGKGKRTLSYTEVVHYKTKK